MKLLVWCGSISLAMPLGCGYVIASVFLVDHPAQSQVIPDSTLPVNSQVTNNGNTSIINGGTTRGTNLFHSFREFSLTTGGTAHFNNSLKIQNIFSRVTGNSISNIDGTLKTNGSANLFFLNPRGVVFGANARLNLGGSVLATTADRINFADGTVFSAIQPQPILTVSIPVGLGLGTEPGKIQVLGSGHQLIAPLFSPVSRPNSATGLQVSPGQTLALVGGDVSLIGGVITAPGGRIEVGSGSNGEVSFSTTNSQWSLDYQRVPQWRNIKLSKRSLLDTSGNGGASIQLQGRQIQLQDGSVLLSQNQGILPDGELRLKASEFIDINGTDPIARIPGGVFSESINLGNSGNIAIFSPKIRLQTGGELTTRTYSLGKGGNISIEAADSLQILGLSPIDSRAVSTVNALTFGSGAAGDIQVTTSQLEIVGGGRLLSSASSTGAGGNVTINASDFVELKGFGVQRLQRSSISASTIGYGRAGNLTINTSRLILADGSRIDTSTVASGFGGNININAMKLVDVSGTAPDSDLSSSITASAFRADPQLQEIFGLPSLPSANSGNIAINTSQLRVTDQALIAVENQGTGDAGSIFVNAPEISFNSGGSITAATASGNGGEIRINSSDLRLDDAFITATAGERGNGGNIEINTDALVLDNSSITANAFSGTGGNIEINTALLLQRDSEVSASSELGLDGQVEINQLNSPSTLFVISAAPIVFSTETAIAPPCSQQKAEFSLTGTSGLPLPPSDLQFPGSGSDALEANALVHRPDGSISLAYSPSLDLPCQK
ncbi:two-partner secretion domain-containing protein [Merismopedia glauca]|nr:filamentous hemagglutinin N-terminal domain-containing protein [Merismopedia glauca]